MTVIASKNSNQRSGGCVSKGGKDCRLGFVKAEKIRDFLHKSLPHKNSIPYNVLTYSYYWESIHMQFLSPKKFTRIQFPLLSAL